MSQKSQPSEQLTSLISLLQSLPAEKYKQLSEMVTESAKIWTPTPGPQTEAYYTNADITFYGGAAGGGKTDLACGLALTTHTESIIFRRQAKQLVGINNRLKELIGSKGPYNGKDEIWYLEDGRTIEVGACKDVGDEEKYQGRPHSLKVFDEITHFQESQFRFLCGWLRSVKPGEPQRILCTGNPPTDSDGEWVIRFWGPWLDPKHPHPAEPGELRWYATFAGDIEKPVPNGDVLIDPANGEEVRPKSRTFIPSRVEDNPFLMQTDYKATLQAMPEPLRSQMLKGDFQAGVGDDPWQVIPTAWVDAAMDRWTPNYRSDMDSMGVDVARGGIDETVIAMRHGGWYAPLIAVPGAATPNGQTGAALVLQHRRDLAPVHVDVIGVGGSVYDHLDENRIQTLPINVSKKSYRKTAQGLGFRNLRAELVWSLREALDPLSKSLIALPNDAELKADLCAPRFIMGPTGIQIESKDDVKKRIGRSTNKGDALYLAHIDTRKESSEEEYYNHVERDATTGY